MVIPMAEIKTAKYKAQNAALKRDLAVGALIYRPGYGLFLQKKDASRDEEPADWDVAASEVPGNESVRDALTKQIAAETGWKLKDVKALLHHREWRKPDQKSGPSSSRWVDEYDFLVTVDEDQDAPNHQPDLKGWQWLTRDSLNDLEKSDKRHVHEMVTKAFDYLGL